MNIVIPAGTSGPAKTQYFINKAYAQYISDSGYSPVLAAPGSNLPFLADVTDGLLLPGGIDLDPIFYNENNIGSFSVDPAKDDFEREAFYAFLNAGKPIFGICRGFQLIAREFIKMFPNDTNNLDYYQHINGHNPTNEYSLGRTYPSHSVEAATNMLYGDGHDEGFHKVFVNSMHHQALIVKPHGKGKNFALKHGPMEIKAYTNIGLGKISGSLIEAFDINGWNDTPIRAVQWHPEELMDVALLQSFFGGDHAQLNEVLQA